MTSTNYLSILLKLRVAWKVVNSTSPSRVCCTTLEFLSSAWSDSDWVWAERQLGKAGKTRAIFSVVLETAAK